MRLLSICTARRKATGVSPARQSCTRLHTRSASHPGHHERPPGSARCRPPQKRTPWGAAPGAWPLRPARGRWGLRRRRCLTRKNCCCCWRAGPAAAASLAGHPPGPLQCSDAAEERVSVGGRVRPITRWRCMNDCQQHWRLKRCRPVHAKRPLFLAARVCGACAVAPQRPPLATRTLRIRVVGGLAKAPSA